jgi:site-specific recombinase XerD
MKEFRDYLKEKNLSKNTISAYEYSIVMFKRLFGEINKTNLLAFKGYMLEHFKVRTVNLRIQALNKYLAYIKKKDLQITAVKIQQKPFL